MISSCDGNLVDTWELEDGVHTDDLLEGTSVNPANDIWMGMGLSGSIVPRKGYENKRIFINFKWILMKYVT